MFFIIVTAVISKYLKIVEYFKDKYMTSAEVNNVLKWIVIVFAILCFIVCIIDMVTRGSDYKKLKTFRKLSNVPNFNHKTDCIYQNYDNDIIAIDIEKKRFCIIYGNENKPYYFDIKDVIKCQSIIDKKIYKELVMNTTSISGNISGKIHGLGVAGGSISNTGHSVQEFEHSKTKKILLKIYLNNISNPILYFNFKQDDKKQGKKELEIWHQKFELAIISLKNND